MKEKYFKGLTRNTYLLTLTSLFADISTEMLYPVLPIFLTQILGQGGAVVGIVEGAAVAMQNIIQGFSGALSDKLQKRKPIAIAGYVIAALSKPFIGLSTSWWGVFGARSVDRLGSGIRSAPRDALIANSAGESHRGKAFGLEGIGDNLGAFLGPIIAVVLLFYFKINIRSIFYFAIIPGLLAVIMIFFVKENKSDFLAKSKLDKNVFKFSPKYLSYLGIIALFGLGNISSSFYILQMRNLGVPLMATILIYAFFNLIAALVSYPAGMLSDKFGRKNILLFSFIVFLISLLGFSKTITVPVIVVLYCLYGVFQGMFRATGKAFASDFVTKNFRASAIGWYNTVVGITGLAASILAGQIYDRLGPRLVFTSAAFFVGLAIVLLFNFKVQKNTSV